MPNPRAGAARRTFSPAVWDPVYASAEQEHGIAPLTDQQIARLLI